jgi:hypothetical protein
VAGSKSARSRSRCTPRGCRPELTCASLRGGLRRRHDLEIVAAMQTDVPGGPPGHHRSCSRTAACALAVAHGWASARRRLTAGRQPRGPSPG